MITSLQRSLFLRLRWCLAALTLLVGFVGCGRSELEGDFDAAVGDVPIGPDRPDVPRALTGISLSPPTVTLAVGSSATLTVTGFFSDGSSADVTGMAGFTVSNASVAAVRGRTVTALRAGTATVTASVSGFSARATVTVPTATLRAIEVNPGFATVGAGGTVRFSAIGVLTDGTRADISGSVLWESSDPSVASVDPGGLATGRAAGRVNISARLGMLSGSASLEVSGARLVALGITPVNPTVPVGVTVRFTVTGTYADGSTADVTASVTWTSSNPASFAVATGGVGSSFNAGRSLVQARLGALVASVTVVVTGARLVSIAITGLISTTPVGSRQNLRATGTYSDGTTTDLTTTVTWTSSDPMVADVSNAAGSQGQVTALAAGTSTITATLGDVRGSASVTVTAATLREVRVSPAMATLPVRVRVAFTATAVYSDGSTADVTTMVLWSSSDPSVLPIDRAGAGATLRPGMVTISASLGAVTGSTVVTVSMATITSVTVAPATGTLPLRGTIALRALGTASDGSTVDLTTSVFWSSLNPGVASVSNVPGSQGVTTGLSAGMATIQVQYLALRATAVVTVTAASLTALTIAPPTATLSVGATSNFRATGTFSDGSSADLTTSVTWSSNVPGVASVSNVPGSQGMVTANMAGMATVTATSGMLSATAAVTVAGAVTLTGLAITPPALTLAAGTSAAVTVTGTYSDGTTADVTAMATWTSSNAMVATALAGRVTAVAPGMATVTARVGMLSATAAVTVPTATVTAVNITPSAAMTSTGGSAAFRAEAVLSDGTRQDVTATAAWATSDASIATVSATGVATGVRPGVVTVTATVAMARGMASLTVTAATLRSIQVSPMDPTVSVGASVRFTATGIYSDGSSSDITAAVAWATSSSATVSVDAAGNGRALGAGTSVVTASVGMLSGSTTVTVTAATLRTLTVAPGTATLSPGGTVSLRALGTYSDGTTTDLTATVTWSSSGPMVASVSNAMGSNGLVTALAPGMVTVTAASAGVTGAATVTVSPATLRAITITPAASTLPAGATVMLRATGTFSDGSTRDLTESATWSSAAAATASVSDVLGSKGLVRGASPGMTTISAQFSGVTGTAAVTVTMASLLSIAVSPADASTTAGLRSNYRATGAYSDGTMADLTASVTWTTADGAVATISNVAGAQGQLLARAAGRTTVSATLGAVLGMTTVTVTGATLRSVSVTPIAISSPVGFRVQYTAFAVFSDGSSRNVTGMAAWTSSDPMVANINAMGNALPVAPGGVTITATFMGVAGSTTLTVVPGTITALQVTPVAPRLAPGAMQGFQAVAVFSDGTSRNVTGMTTWTSSNPMVLTIGTLGPMRGVGTAVGAGTATVTATYMGSMGSTPVTVTSSTVVLLSVNPAAITVPVGARRQYTVQAVFSDGTSRDVTGMATWTSSNPMSVQVSDTPGSRGLAVAVAAGTATITAQWMGLSGTATFTATPAMLTTVQVTPFTPSINVGAAQQFQATGIYSDGTSAPLTNMCVWTSSDNAVAVVTTGGAPRGNARGLSAGTATITADCMGVRGSTTLTVTNATITRIQVTPFVNTVPVGYAVQLQATAIYSDGTTRPVTGMSTWTSSLPGIAFVSDAPGSRGFTTALAPGMATVTVQFLGATGTATVTVTSATLRSLAIAPVPAVVAPGANLQLNATGTFSDGTTLDLTNFVTWLSTDITVADVSNAPGSRGLATGFRAGMTTVTAERSGVRGMTTLSVR
ncbi:MAG: Ig-like domain-containing protein [Deltaproteobacteria bacterium]|nr:Ig-like domain-containing protein [Deltaproteobacteria bacterium]